MLLLKVLQNVRENSSDNIPYKSVAYQKNWRLFC